MQNTEYNKEELLQVRKLTTSFRIEGDYYAAVDGISFDIHKNEVLAIVGESGCGKSAMALSLLSLHNPAYSRMEGEIIFHGQNLLDLNENELNKVRGKYISMIFQDALSALNPLHRIGKQIEETLLYHTDFDKERRRRRALELLDNVGIANPELTYSQYPHELSGGMRQRVMISIAIAAKPDLLIADEPTTALDVTIQAQILDLLRDLKSETGKSIVLITHDLGVVSEMADRVIVMYAGQIVEMGHVDDILKNPQHPYTRSLLSSRPSALDQGARLKTIQGIVPALKELPRTGCRFSHRIPWINQDAHEAEPSYHTVGDEHIVLCTCYKNFEFQ